MRGLTKESVKRIAQFSDSKTPTIDAIEMEFKSLLDELDDLPTDGREEARQYLREMLEEFGNSIPEGGDY